MATQHFLKRNNRRFSCNEYSTLPSPDFTTNLVYKWPGNGAIFEVWDSNPGISKGSLTYDTGQAGLQAFKGDGSTAYVTTTTSISAPSSYSLSAWFKTTASVGFPILAFDAGQTSLSATHDRMMGVNSSGNAFFGANVGNYAISTLTYNNGTWYHIVATSTSGTSLVYINGVQVGNVANGGGSSYSGYWKIGSVYMTNWSQGSVNYFGGDIQDVRVYSVVLTSANVSTLYVNGPRS